MLTEDVALYYTIMTGKSNIARYCQIDRSVDGLLSNYVFFDKRKNMLFLSLANQVVTNQARQSIQTINETYEKTNTISNNIYVIYWTIL